MSRAEAAEAQRLDRRERAEDPDAPRQRRLAKFTCDMLMAKRLRPKDGEGQWQSMSCDEVFWPDDFER